MDLGHYLQWDPHPFLFGSPARYVAGLVLLLDNRLTLDPLLVTEPARRFRPPLRPQLPLQDPPLPAAHAPPQMPYIPPQAPYGMPYMLPPWGYHLPPYQYAPPLPGPQ